MRLTERDLFIQIFPVLKRFCINYRHYCFELITATSSLLSSKPWLGLQVVEGSKSLQRRKANIVLIYL